VELYLQFCICLHDTYSDKFTSENVHMQLINTNCSCDVASMQLSDSFIITNAKIMCIFCISFNVLIYILIFLVHVGLILSFRIWKIKFVPQWTKM